MLALVVVCIIATASFINIFATQGVKLNRKNKTINVGQTFNLKVRGKKVKKIVYKSSNNKVASVSKKGKVKANREGNATITVTISFKNKKKVTKLKCKVKVVSKKKTNVNNKKETPTSKAVEVTTSKNAEEIATKEIETNEIFTRETIEETISVETQPEMKHENRETTGDFVLPELSIK